MCFQYSSLTFVFIASYLTITSSNNNHPLETKKSARTVELHFTLEEGKFFIMASKDWFSKRSLLLILVMCGFAVNYIYRLNINIAIVSMVKRQKLENISNTYECTQDEVSKEHLNEESNNTLLRINEDDKRYHWDETQQAHVLGGFYWLAWTAQIPGGILAKKYGTKLVFGLSNLIACLLAMLIPLCANLSYQAIVTIRILQGFMSGLAWPAMHDMAAKWIPPNERSKFVSAYSVGPSIGAAITFCTCGFLIEWLDWPSVFYVTGLIGIIWFLCWWLMVYNTPAEHPNISDTERLYIQRCIGRHVCTEKKLAVPWKNILLSLPVWIISLAQWGALWGLFTLFTQTPTYFKNILGIDIGMTGIFSAIPHVFKIFFTIFISFIADYLLIHDILTRTYIRRAATILCTVIQGAFILGLAYTGCSSWVAALCVTLAVGCTGGLSPGPLANQVDISPNFSSVIAGFSNTLSVGVGFLSPILVGYLTYNNQTSEQWKKFFIISALMTSLPGVLYIFFVSAEVQPWNMSSLNEPEEGEELQKEDYIKINEKTI